MERYHATARALRGLCARIRAWRESAVAARPIDADGWWR